MHTIFKAKADSCITVIGDVILDRYVYGQTSRISPEAPVPVVRITAEEIRAGGAANVALNIKNLAMPVRLAGITGRDESSSQLQQILQDSGIDSFLHQQQDFPTITKVRVLSQNQQLLRMDYEDPAEYAEVNAVVELSEKCLADTTVVVLSDYAKGALASVQEIIDIARQQNIPVLVDPKGTDFSRYKNASVITPNQKEFEAVVGTCRNEQDMTDKAVQLARELGIDTILVTRGARGISLIQQNGQHICHLPAVRQEVFDVTGAGDTVIATYAAAIASGYDPETAVHFANHAAGIVVGKLGAASVSTRELNDSVHRHHYSSDQVMDLEELKTIVTGAKSHGERIVLTNGCFDILHSGHIRCLEEARTHGDRLIVAINDDDSVQRLKGESRPVNKLHDRVRVLSALSAVDWVIAFSEDTPADVISELSPDVLIKGDDYSVDEIAGADHVLANGGEVITVSLQEGVSTSGLIEKIRSTGEGE